MRLRPSHGARGALARLVWYDIRGYDICGYDINPIPNTNTLRTMAANPITPTHHCAAA